MTTHTFTIPGRPKGQGSMSLWRAPGGGTQVRYPGPTVEHRNLMINVLSTAWQGKPPLTGPLSLTAALGMDRPKAHYGTGKNSGTIKDSAPAWPIGAPDLDKGVRLIGDALTIAGVIADDSQIVIIKAMRYWADGKPLTHIQLREVQ